MRTGPVIRTAVTLLAVGCVIYTVFFQTAGEFPFLVRTIDARTLVVASRPDAVLPTVLQAGDRIVLDEQDLAIRAGLYNRTTPGESYELNVRRDGRLLTVEMTSGPRQGTGFDALDAVLVLLLVLGLSTLWWGRDWAAAGLSLASFAFILNIFLYFLSLPPVAGFVIVLLNQTLVILLAPAGLYLAALALSGPALTERLRLLFHALLGSFLLATGVIGGLQVVAFVVFGYAALERLGLSSILYMITILIPVAVLLAALPRADRARRLRLRWIVFSVALFVGPVVWGNLGNISETFTTRGVIRQAIWWSALFCGLAGLLYSVLRKRVVAMSIAVNRALVYGLIAAFVIGVFALLAALIETTAIGRDAGFALTVGVSLGIGLVLEALRDRINTVVERFFFRRRYEAEEALRRFAHQCAYIERADRLLDATEEEIHRHVQPRSSAIYESSQDGYTRLRQGGEPLYPEVIDLDDRAFVAMRANRAAVDLDDVQTALGTEGYVFPMVVRGVLRGALVCGPRTEEYSRDERNLLAEVSHQAGIALHALRARDNAAFVREFASGELDPGKARERARELHAEWAMDA